MATNYPYFRHVYRSDVHFTSFIYKQKDIEANESEAQNTMMNDYLVQSRNLKDRSSVRSITFVFILIDYKILFLNAL